MLGLRLDGYEPDLHHDAAVAFCIQAREDELFSPLHQHRKGQLILALQALIDGRNVQQVAQMLGYDSTTAFITMFKKGLGQTPGRYLNGLATASQQSTRPGLPQ